MDDGMAQDESRDGSPPEMQKVEQGLPEGSVFGEGSIPLDGRVPPLKAFTVADAERYIAAVRWQFAKTMPQWPHWYTVRDWLPEVQDQFEAFARLIRCEGTAAPWPRDSVKPRYNNAYLVVQEWMYWTMPGSIAEQSVINRAEPDL